MNREMQRIAEGRSLRRSGRKRVLKEISVYEKTLVEETEKLQERDDVLVNEAHNQVTLHSFWLIICCLFI